KQKYQGLAKNYLTGKFFKPASELLAGRAMVRMQDAATVQAEEDKTAKVLDGVQLRQDQLKVMPPPMATAVGGQVTINPDDDRTYQSMRRQIQSLVSEANFKDPKKGEQILLKSLAKLDHARAEQVSSSESGNWLAAEQAGTNGWSKILTPEAYDRLTQRARTR